MLDPDGGSSPERVVNVLLVEDDPGDAFLVEDLLSGAGGGFRITAARNLAEALETIGPATDCVLLDLGLPDAQGLDGLRTLLGVRPSVAVVVLTGFDDRTSGARAVAIGAQDYLTKGAVDGETLARSLRYAIARLERGLLAQPIILDEKLAFATRYQPGGRRALLGGDFLDAIELDDGTVRLVVGDICGHGADEAALGVALRVAWRALVLANLPANQVLGALDRVLRTERESDEVFATVCDLALDPSRDTAELRLAGHPSPLLVNGGSVTELDAPERGPLLGVLEDATWPVTRIALPEAWTLIAYTDGIIEGRQKAGSSNLRLGTEGLVGLVSDALARTGDLGSLADLLVAGAERENGTPLQDDLALFLLSNSRPRSM